METKIKQIGQNQINEELIKDLKEILNSSNTIKIQGSNKERRVFKDKRAFEWFSGGFDNEDYGLNPFDDYTYEWFDSFLHWIIDNLERNLPFDEIEDLFHEFVDSETDIYTSDLTAWLNDKPTNVYYLDEAIKEYKEIEGVNLLQIAQYNRINECCSHYLEVIKGLLEDE